MDPREEKNYFVYILLCSDQTFYTGYTTDLERRLAEHNVGKGAKYTRGRRPVQLLASWSFPSLSQALRVEAAIKKRSRKEKEDLVKSPPPSGQMVKLCKPSS